MTVRGQEFPSLKQRGHVHGRVPSTFLMHERFSLSCFTNERERIAQFVVGYSIRIKSALAMFLSSTLAEAMVRGLECKHAHKSHH